MKHESKKRIIQILQEYGDWIGNDSRETDELIKEMNQIRAVEVDLSLKKEIEEYMKYLCQLIGYEPTEENNSSRKIEIVTIRDAIARHTFDKYSKYVIAKSVVASFFGKDRASGYQMEERTKFRIETGDEVFINIYNRLTESLNIAA